MSKDAAGSRRIYNCKEWLESWANDKCAVCAAPFDKVVRVLKGPHKSKIKYIHGTKESCMISTMELENMVFGLIQKSRKEMITKFKRCPILSLLPKCPKCKAELEMVLIVPHEADVGRFSYTFIHKNDASISFDPPAENAFWCSITRESLISKYGVSVAS